MGAGKHSEIAVIQGGGYPSLPHNNFARYSAAVIPEGDYVISPSGHSDYALDAAGGYIDAKADIWLYQKNGTEAQTFSSSLKGTFSKPGGNTLGIKSISILCML